MNIIRRAILASAVMAGLSPAFAQAPPPVPALPDTERRTSYSISGSTCACAVGFQLYGDATDVDSWIEVFINGVPKLSSDGAFGWKLTSPTGPLSAIPRPITDAVLTFNSAQTATVQIVGARRPRRVSQFSENRGVAARDLNQAITDMVAMLRENWDKTNDLTGRAVLARPGETLNLLPILASRQNLGACFDSGGNLTSCISIPSSTFVAGNGILFSGVSPTTITNNIQAGTSISITGTNPMVINATTTNNIEQENPGGRLTLASGTPVMATSQTAATTLFYAPYIGKYVPLFTAGTGMRILPFTASDTDAVGLSIVLGSSWAANTNYDAYAYVNGSSAGLCTSPDWSQGLVAGSNAVGSSSRGTGAGSAEQQIFKGFLTNKNTMTCRIGNATTVSCAVNECTFLGSFRTGAAGQISFTYGTQGTAGTFNLWNAYNQQQFCSVSADGTLSWTYTSLTIRQANANAINQFNFMTGAAAGSIDASVAILIRPGATTTAVGTIGIALNSTTVMTKSSQVQQPATSANFNVAPTVSLPIGGVLGPNFISANENGDGTNSITFFGQGFMSLRACMWM